MLSEDFLRLEYPENYDEEGRYSEAYLREQYESRPERYQMPGYVPSTPEDGILSSRSVISYLPYYDEGHKIHIVRLKGKKEVFLEELSVTPLSGSFVEMFLWNHITEDINLMKKANAI